MATIGDISVTVRADLTQFKQDLQEIYGLIDDLQRRLSSLADVHIGFDMKADENTDELKTLQTDELARQKEQNDYLRALHRGKGGQSLERPAR